jgi:hypothetical protein
MGRRCIFDSDAARQAADRERRRQEREEMRDRWLDAESKNRRICLGKSTF